MVIKLRLRKDRFRFHFYFGDSLELCTTNQEWKNKMHVIHCSVALVKLAGLLNILPIGSQCLNGDLLEAVLVTELSVFFTGNGEKLKPISLLKSVEFDLQ